MVGMHFVSAGQRVFSIFYIYYIVFKLTFSYGFMLRIYTVQVAKYKGIEAIK